MAAVAELAPAVDTTLCANDSETATPRKFTVEGAREMSRGNAAYVWSNARLDRRSRRGRETEFTYSASPYGS